MRSLGEHGADLVRLSQALKRADRPVCLSRTPLTSNVTRTPHYKQGRPLVNTSALRHTLGIQDGLLLCEPHVTMEEMVKASLKQGMIPKIVPEFRGITVGGAIQGAALESSSHRLGLFNDICPFIEVALGNGEIHRLSEGELFNALPGSYGSLAITTLIGVELEPAQPYVRLRAIPFDSREALCSYLTAPQSTHYLEGFVLEPGRYIALEGHPTDDPKDLRRAGTPSRQWFIQDLLAGKEGTLPLTDYLFRLDRGAFWMGRYILHPLLMLSFLLKWGLAGNKIRRYLEWANKRWPSKGFCRLFGSLMTSRNLYRGLHKMPEGTIWDNFLIQDSFLPPHRAADFIAQMEEAITPLWLCPVHKSDTPQLFSPQHIEGGPILLNVGTYGLVDDAHIATRYLEQAVKEMGGRKALYSHSTYTPEEFWRLYDEPTYRRLRDTYWAEGKFLSIEKKVLS